MAGLTTPRQRRWRWPRQAVVVPLDVGLAVAVCLVLNALALRSYAEYTVRARFSEAIVTASAARYAVVEQYAHSGRPMDMPDASGEAAPAWRARPSDHLGRASPGGAAKPGPAASGAMAEKNTVDLVKQALSMQVGPEDRAGSVSRYVSTVRLQGAAVVVEGSLRGAGGGPYQFALAARVQDARVPQVIVWDCGSTSHPTGWTGPTVLLADPPGQGWLPNRCRAGRVAS